MTDLAMTQLSLALTRVFAAAAAPPGGAAGPQGAENAAAGAAEQAAAEGPSFSDIAADPTKALGMATTWWDNNSALVTQYAVRGAGALALFIAALVVSGWIATGAAKALGRAHIEVTLARFLSKALRYLILLLAVVACLGVLGVDMTSPAALIGASGLAIGLAFQGTLANIAAGIMLAIFRPFRAGDMVNVVGQIGLVNEIDIFNTKIDTIDNRRIIIPNNKIMGEIIENMTYNPTRKVTLTVGIDYNADIDRTREALLAAVRACDLVEAEPGAEIAITGFADSAVNWEVRVWIKREQVGPGQQQLFRAMKIELDRAGIAIPFPQRVVHLTGSAPAPAATQR